MSKLRTAFSERPRLYSVLLAVAVIAVAVAVIVPLAAGGDEEPAPAAEENPAAPEGGSAGAGQEELSEDDKDRLRKEFGVDEDTPVIILDQKPGKKSDLPPEVLRGPAGSEEGPAGSEEGE